MSNLKATARRVIILPDEPKKVTESGIILTEIKPDVPNKGTVISIGKNVEELKEGDYVMFDPFSIVPIEHDNKEYFLMYERNVILKFN